jgi:hypothetical protein
MTKAHTKKAHTTIAHRLNPTIINTDYYYQIGNCNAIGRKRGAESIVLPSMRSSQVPQGVSSNR